ncbi:phenylacetyl-CoA ligase-like protein [Pseudovirgaria hyperparasitica]|uniref:Phenylacetyl-CoA ligase-like protein n=1 Tax=Pseudovirgaria hyperparasitica TaxID=470096 RepID=A0A6A6W4E3_9PEZI|nr:phenylacetyl-CoA ligase-like protein [Pseudovirgaria hyperparasitica]KAF2757742.1 phenylacetyl-CoA ligase-like protein [Pseudovirgaria hyperparasitica]
MVFGPPAWAPKLPFDPPDSVSIPDFLFDEQYGRHPLGYAKNPFTCGLSGATYNALEVKERIDFLARGMAKEFGWSPNNGTEWDKVVNIFSVNTIDYNVLNWAIHRLNGIATPANAVYSQKELEHQLRDSGAKYIFTCLPLLDIAKGAAQTVGIPKTNIYMLELSKEATGGQESPKGYKTVNDLIRIGSKEARLEPLKWEKGQGARQVAFLCYSSGTSGLPKGVMISHRNVIANTLQVTTFEKHYRDTKRDKSLNNQSEYTENGLGLLPMSHIYGLIVICHVGTYRGDGVIVLPRFEMKPYLNAIQTYKIATLYLVPPIIILMTKQKDVVSQFDMSSVDNIFTGAAPLGSETAQELQNQFPSWCIRQGYGLTETCTVVCTTSGHDVWFGSSGSLIPGVQAKIVTVEGVECTGYEERGELVVKSPSVTLGYLHNEKSTKETYIDGWMRTGDEAMVCKAPSGNEHIIITDRIKELIKVKGHQVAPAELEAHLLTHPAVADCCVIQVPDAHSGEIPKAFVVKSPSVGLEENDRHIKRDIQRHVEKHKAKYKWITGGVEFIDVIPKSPSGKILRRFLRDKDKERRTKEGAKL